jgi:hydrogenase nickel incorporation protein HypA/HybF
MHEMGIAAQIIDIALASIPTEMANHKVERINLKIGKLAAVVPESLRFCFEIAAASTRLADAQLTIQSVDVVAQCRDCGLRWTVTGPVFICRRCESGSLEIISGQELDIVSIDIEA